MGRGGQGRPTQPTSLQVLRGHRVEDNEPAPAKGDYVAPESLNAAARAYWDLLASDLLDKGMLTPWDVKAFTVWCEAAATHDEGR